MIKYYEVTLEVKKFNRKISYIAESFSVDSGILMIKSKKFGNVVVEIENDDVLSVNEIKITERW